MPAPSVRNQARRLLPPCEWPATIRREWDAAFGLRPRPRRRGEGGGLPRQQSMVRYQQSLSRYLGHLHCAGELQDGRSLLTYLRDQHLQPYFEVLLDQGARDYTIFGYFESLRTVAGRFYPKESLGHVMRIGGVPLRKLLNGEKRDIAPPRLEELIAWCKDMFTSGVDIKDPEERRLAVRDAAIGAVFTSVGPRRRSIALMDLGVHLVQRQEDAAWWVLLRPEDDKQDRPYAYKLDPWTWPIIERYLRTERTELLDGQTSNALWLGRRGDRLTPKAIWKNMRLRTEARFGRKYGTHVFRYSIASDGLAKGGKAAIEASIRLGHDSSEITTLYVHPSAITPVAERHSAAIDGRAEKGRIMASRLYGDWPTPEEEGQLPRRRRMRANRHEQLDMFSRLEPADSPAGASTTSNERAA